jgi:hypothetical protein
MTPSNSAKSQMILWPQLFGLVGVQAAMTLCWVIYGLYLPKLLTQAGLQPEAIKGFVGLLVLVENVLAVFIEPLMGDRSDRIKRWMGLQFPVLMLGVVLASVVFLAIPAVMLVGLDPLNTRSLLVGMLVLWTMAMAMFRAPLLSLLGRYAGAVQLPYAASFILLASTGMRSFATLVHDLWVGLGATVAFGLGSFALLGAIAYLRWVDPYGQVDLNAMQTTQAPLGKRLNPRAATLVDLSLILLVGLGFGLGSELLRRVLNPNGSLGMGFELMLFTIVHLCTLVPFGQLASSWGMVRSLVLSLVGTALALVLYKFGGNPILEVLCLLGLGALFSIVNACILPFALRLVPATQAGLGMGMLFGGMMLASTLLGAINTRVGSLQPAQNTWFGAVGLVLALVGVALARQRIKRLEA